MYGYWMRLSRIVHSSTALANIQLTSIKPKEPETRRASQLDTWSLSILFICCCLTIYWDSHL